MRLIARLIPPVLVVSLVYGLWFLVLRVSLSRAVEVLAGLTP
jgi:hypothetical protein